jgi:putative tricarboxylic transport membrane protein
MIESPEFVFKTVAMVFLATVAMFILGLSMVRWIVKVLQIPRSKLMPIVFTLCVIGAFAIQSRIFDIKVMVFFGILGFLMREMDYPVAPMILGIILGDILDKNLRRALVISDGNVAPFFTRPISLVLVLFIAFALISRTRWFLAFVALIKSSVRGLFRRKEG